MMGEREMMDPMWGAVRSLCDEIRMPRRGVDALREVYERPETSRLVELRRYVDDLVAADYAVSRSAAQRLIADATVAGDADAGDAGVGDAVAGAAGVRIPVSVAGKTTATESRAVAVLAVFLEAALRCWEVTYVPRDIPRDVFASTMANMSLFMAERIAAYDDVLFDRGWWCCQYTSGRQYRIGMLNFEMATYDGEPAGLPFASGERLLHVHIPSDADLDASATHASYQAARRFFAHYYPQWADAPMVTETWLLSPVLRDVLRPGSRILAFADDFDVLQVDAAADNGTMFVFGRDDLPVEQLPRRTSLQRGLADLLRGGGHIGTAFGRLRM